MANTATLNTVPPAPRVDNPSGTSDLDTIQTVAHTLTLMDGDFQAATRAAVSVVRTGNLAQARPALKELFTTLANQRKGDARTAHFEISLREALVAVATDESQPVARRELARGVFSDMQSNAGGWAPSVVEPGRKIDMPEHPASVGGAPAPAAPHCPSWVHALVGKPSQVTHAPAADAPNPPPYWGGSQAEQDKRLARLIGTRDAPGELLKLQAQLAAGSHEAKDRTFHKEGVVMGATFQLYEHPQLPTGADGKQVPPAGLFDPKMMEAVSGITARLSYGRGDSNLNSLMPDVRGLAVRFQTPDGKMQDLTATNAEVPFFHDPAELTAFGYVTMDLNNLLKDVSKNPAKLLNDRIPDLAAQLKRLEPEKYGDEKAALVRATQMMRDAVAPTFPIHSLASTTFWSGAPIRFGDQLVKFAFRPVQRTHGLPSKDLFGELKEHPDGVQYELCIQFYTDPKNTPLDPPAHWNSPLIPMGRLKLDTSSLGSPAQAALQEAFSKQEGFNPGNAMKGNEPYGLNAQRATLYKADATARGVSPRRCPLGFG